MSFEYSSQGCPKCGQKYIVGRAACSACGLVFAKWEQKQQGSGVDGSVRLELMWQEVLNRWSEESAHTKFVQESQREHNLPFASLKYRKVLEADPHSDVANRMQKRVQQIVISNFLSLPVTAAQEDSFSAKPLYVLLASIGILVALSFNIPSQYMSTAFPLALIAVIAFVAIHQLKKRLL